MGATKTLEDQFAVARQHPKLPVVNEAAYGAEVVLFRVGEALGLMNRKERTAADEEQLRRVLKDLRAVATALRPLYRRLAPADTAWSDDARPAALVDMWMAVLPQIKRAAAGGKRSDLESVRATILRADLQPWPKIALPWGAARDTLMVNHVLGDEGARALKTILGYCLGRIAVRPAAFQIVAAILGMTENSVRHARDRYRKMHPEKRTGS